MNNLKYLCHKITGAPEQTLLTLYKAHLRPILEGGYMLNYRANKMLQNRIESIQQRFLTWILGVPIETRGDDIRIDKNILSIKGRYELAIIKFASKNTNKFSINSIEQFSTDKKINKKTSFENEVKNLLIKYRISWQNLLTINSFELKKIIMNFEIKQWILKQRNSIAANLTSDIIKTKRKITHLKRKQQVMYNQICYGVIQSNDFLYRIKRKENKKCRFCDNANENNVHFLFYCKVIKIKEK